MKKAAKKTDRYPKRVVLGVGCPILTFDCLYVGILSGDLAEQSLEIPESLSAFQVPRYRLVLERVED